MGTSPRNSPSSSPPPVTPAPAHTSGGGGGGLAVICPLCKRALYTDGWSVEWSDSDIAAVAAGNMVYAFCDVHQAAPEEAIRSPHSERGISGSDGCAFSGAVTSQAPAPGVRCGAGGDGGAS